MIKTTNLNSIIKDYDCLKTSISNGTYRDVDMGCYVSDVDFVSKRMDDFSSMRFSLDDVIDVYDTDNMLMSPLADPVLKDSFSKMNDVYKYTKDFLNAIHKTYRKIRNAVNAFDRINDLGRNYDSHDSYVVLYNDSRDLDTRVLWTGDDLVSLLPKITNSTDIATLKDATIKLDYFNNSLLVISTKGGHWFNNSYDRVCGSPPLMD